MLLNNVESILQEKIKNKFLGRAFYIPSYINYTVPISEKQFVGNIPNGSYIDLIPGRNTFTIRWDNYKNVRTDLDLHLTSAHESYGWNNYYRNDERSIMYSGDMTDATNGAFEAFSFYPEKEKTYFLEVCNFTEYNNVPFQFFLAQKIELKNQGFIVDVKDAVFSPINLSFMSEDTNQLIGIIKDSKFYFYNVILGGTKVPNTMNYDDKINAVTDKMQNMLLLRQYLIMGGATILNEESVEKYSGEVIDLSPSCLSARTLLDLTE